MGNNLVIDANFNIVKTIDETNRSNVFNYNSTQIPSDILITSRFQNDNLLLSMKAYSIFCKYNLPEHNVREISLIHKDVKSSYVLLEFDNIYDIILDYIDYTKSIFKIGHGSHDEFEFQDYIKVENKEDLIILNQNLLENIIVNMKNGKLKMILPFDIVFKQNFSFDYFHYFDMYFSDNLINELLKNNINGIEVRNDLKKINI